MLALSGTELMGWVGFVVLVLGGASLIPVLAALLSRRLPERRASGRALPVLRLGRSPKTRRSPRHAVAAHRGLLTGSILVGIGLALIPFVGALGTLDPSGLLVAIGFVMPSLIVVLHGRRRDLVPSATGKQARDPDRDGRAT